MLRPVVSLQRAARSNVTLRFLSETNIKDAFSSPFSSEEAGYAEIALCCCARLPRLRAGVLLSESYFLRAASELIPGFELLCAGRNPQSFSSETSEIFSTGDFQDIKIFLL